MLVSTSTVYAQTLKKKSNNEFVLDSLGLKEYSTLIYEKKSIPQLIQSFNSQLSEKDTTISLLNFKITEYKKDITNFESMMLIRDEKDELKDELFKQKMRKIKWQRNKAYIGGGVAIILSILVLSK